jgi:predicted MFS family arabinose efflux permease
VAHGCLTHDADPGGPYAVTTLTAPSTRDFVLGRYVTTAVCARLADEGARVAILLLVLQRTGRASLGGLLVAALMVPHVVAAPIAGAAADAARRRRPLYVTVFAAYAGMLVAAALLIGRSTPAAVAVLIVAGCCAPLLIGGLTSLLGDLAGDRLERAFGLDATSYGLAGVAGPALAAVLAGLVGGAWALVALAGLVVVGAVLVGSLPLPVRTAADRPAHRGSPFAGVRVIWRSRSLAAATMGSTLNQAGFGALPLAAAALAAQAHQPAYTGVVLSVNAVGGLTGSLLCTRYPIRRFRPDAVLLVCLTAYAVPLLAAASLPAGWPALALFFVTGLFNGPLTVALFAIRDREAPAGARTQVFTLGAGMKVTGAAAGAAIAGLVASVGSAALLAGVAAAQLLGAAVAWTLPRRGPGHARARGTGEYR